ncbi:MAG TPA: hypothetical protein VF166_00425 [Gemmatimonadaceae bacterium]
MSDTPLPTLRVAGAVDSALAPDVLDTLGVADLARFLAHRRWFAGKGRTVTSTAMRDIVPLAWASYRAAAARLEVETDDGAVAEYQLLLSALPPSALPRSYVPIARIDSQEEGDGFLIDATEDPTFRALLGTTFETGAVFVANHARWTVEPLAGQAARVEPDGDTRVIAGEQSNTSIVYDDHAILKLFRRLEPGDHPDVEIGRFLATRTDFRGTPALLGVITFEWEGAPSVAGMLQRFVPGADNAWEYALRSAREYLRAKGEPPVRATGVARTRATREVPARATHEPPANPFARDAERLGRVTRALHEALASDGANPDFAPARASAEDLDRWAAETRAMMARALELLDARVQAGALDGRATAAARALLGRRDALDDRVTEMVSAIGDDLGMRIRTHGDYHLGQVLRTPDAHFLIIDFEGEPARPLAERRAKVSPLRDVAGMLRSFAYAASMSARELAGERIDPTVEIRSAHWEREARAAFLEGYLHADDASSALLPHARDDTEALLMLFDTEKVFYELAYELNNRPEWVWVPLRGVAKLL